MKSSAQPRRPTTTPAFRQSWRRCRRIAGVLLDGPEAIFPPSRGRGGWYEPVLSVVRRTWPVGGDPYSAVVFVDNTNNRHRAFLPPLVRFAWWEQSYEDRVRRKRAWPRVVVQQHLLTEVEQDGVDGLMRTLDRALGQTGFVPAGLILDRGEPDGCSPDVHTPLPQQIGYRVRRWNFCQRITFEFANDTPSSAGLATASEALLDGVRALCSGDGVRYREKYDGFEPRPPSFLYRPPRRGEGGVGGGAPA